MRANTKSRPSHLRAVRAYLIGMLGLALLLFSITLISLVNQQVAVKELSDTNIRYFAERLGTLLEIRAGQSAQDCLSPSRVNSVAAAMRNPTDPGGLQKLRGLFEQWTSGDGIASSFFVFSADTVAFPRLEPVTTPFREWQLQSGPLAGRFTRLVKAAETAQYDEPRNALLLYEQASGMDVPERWRAFAVAKRASMLKQLGRISDAVALYRRVLQQYGDVYDDVHLPYAVGFALRLGELRPSVYNPYPSAALQLYDQLIEGRWELSYPQVMVCAANFEQLLGISTRRSTPFLRHFEAALALNGVYKAPRPGQSQDVIPLSIHTPREVVQLYLSPIALRLRGPVYVGFQLNRRWLEDRLLPECIGTLGQDRASPGVTLRHPTDHDSGENAETEIRITLNSALLGWNLGIPADLARHSQQAARREVLFLGISAAMFLCILWLGIYLLIRVNRDLHWLEMRNDFVNAVSHELKTPLSLIRLYSETLAAGDDDFTTEERRSYVQIISRESQRLSYMIDNVLNYATIERGQPMQQQRLRPSDLSATVQQIVNDYARYIERTGFIIRKEFQPGLPWVRFDRSMVSQLVLNLLDNARKYSGGSKVITVRMSSRVDEVWMEVEDRGIGIPPEEQEKIFQPFYQIPDGRAKSGSGLGLYLVRHAMDGLGGRVDVESRAGGGSTFRLVFPIESVSQVTPRPSVAAARSAT